MGRAGGTKARFVWGISIQGDPTLETARLLLPGGLSSKPLKKSLSDARSPAAAADEEVYLVHRDSVVTPQQ
jgi:hypothetical protein